MYMRAQKGGENGVSSLLHSTSFERYLTIVLFLFVYISSDEEPPRKKRRSKWDITPPEPSSTAGSQEATVSSQLAPAPGAIELASNVPSSAIAAAAAAKINAMLASQGKLAKSDPPLAKVSTVHVHVLNLVILYSG
jgi:hypothetical protein